MPDTQKISSKTKIDSAGVAPLLPGHTPGPWYVRRANKPTDGEYDYGIGAEIHGEARCIAETFGRVAVNVRPDAFANARLIAASPDLLEALREFVHQFDADQIRFSENANIARRQSLAAARAAIAKAEGR